MAHGSLPELALGILGRYIEPTGPTDSHPTRQEREIIHAQDVLRWIRILYPNPSPELETAGLLHDSERLVNSEFSNGFKGSRDSADYLAHKKAHATRSAELARKNLTALGVPPQSVDRTVFLILHHDDTGAEVEKINDPELKILVAADTFSFFTSKNAANMLTREGPGRVKDKVRFMIEKMPPSLRQLLLQQQIPNPEIHAIKNDILQEFGVTA